MGQLRITVDIGKEKRMTTATKTETKSDQEIQEDVLDEFK